MTARPGRGAGAGRSRVADGGGNDAGGDGSSGAVADLPAREAIPRLLEKHGDLIYSLGLRLCDTPDAAEDLVQETFLRALRSWEGFEGRSRPSTWLYTIATRACRRMQRRKAGQPRRMEPLSRLLPSGDEGVVQIPAGDDPEEEAARREAVEAVRAAIAELPLDFRLPFVLKEMAGFSVAEVSDVLGVKEATVKTRLHRARLRVREAVAGSLPRRAAPPPDHDREECLALLRAKQMALDRDVAFPLDDDVLCERCRSLFRTLDLTRDACAALRAGGMPGELREALGRELATA